MYWVADVSNMDGRPLGLFRRSLQGFSSLPTPRGSSTDSELGTGLLPRPLLATTDQG